MPAVLSPRPSRPDCCLRSPALVVAPHRPCSTPTPSPAARRRLKPYSNRRRTSQRAPRPSEPVPIHPFDQLPWIAALDAPPSNRWDIADLSQIPDDRRSKMFARCAAPDLIQTPPPRASTPPCATPRALAATSRPTTPLSRFIPSRVLFHNLMPVLCESPPSNSDHDPCTSSPLQPSFFQLLSPRLD